MVTQTHEWTDYMKIIGVVYSKCNCPSPGKNGLLTCRESLPLASLALSQYDSWACFGGGGQWRPSFFHKWGPRVSFHT